MMQELTLKERLLILSETIRMTEKAFAHWESATITPDELGEAAKEFFDKAAAAENRADFQKVMWAYFGQLRNAHSNYIDRAAPFPHGGVFPLSLLESDGSWLVKEDDTGLTRPGDKVVSIAGKSMNEWLNEMNQWARIADWRMMAGRLSVYFSHYYMKEKADIELLNDQGNTRTVTLSRQPIDYNSHNNGDTSGKWLQQDKTAYIHIPSFNHSRFEEKALELIGEYQHASSIIIDVRGNGGGSTPGRLTHKLMNRPYRWWKEMARHPEFLCRRHPNAEISFTTDYRFSIFDPDYTQPSAETSYQGNVIILVDRFTGSAAEDFTMQFIDNGRAIIIGERTYGSTGQPLVQHFDDGNIVVLVGAVRSYFPNGDPFENVGIVPDIEVPVRREDLYQRRDRTLEKALEVIKNA